MRTLARLSIAGLSIAGMMRFSPSLDAWTFLLTGPSVICGLVVLVMASGWWEA